MFFFIGANCERHVCFTEFRRQVMQNVLLGVLAAEIFETAYKSSERWPIFLVTTVWLGDIPYHAYLYLQVVERSVEFNYRYSITNKPLSLNDTILENPVHVHAARIYLGLQGKIRYCIGNPLVTLNILSDCLWSSLEQAKWLWFGILDRSFLCTKGASIFLCYIFT